MSTYGLENVIRMWGAGQLTPKQTIGQMLQLICDMDKRIKELERDKERRDRGERGEPATGGKR